MSGLSFLKLIMIEHIKMMQIHPILTMMVNASLNKGLIQAIQVTCFG